MQRPVDDRFLMSRRELEDKMTVLLGGRAAEMILGDDVSTGAADDLAKATDIARGIVMRFGMDEKLGPVAWDTDQGSFLQEQPGVFWRQRRYSDQTAHEIDIAVREHVEAARARAVGILRDNREALDEGAALLLAHETLTGDELPKVKTAQAA
jgi:cell division protease FtsH